MNYKIPCSWQVYGYMDIEADSLDEAISIAEDDSTPLPDGNYVDGSFEIDNNMIEFTQFLNNEKHVCKPLEYCMCSINALEPDENCSIHGIDLHPRCVCGRFVKSNK